jgi:predicted metal-dependent enzyme (double-stranded beta helix superfamily)
MTDRLDRFCAEMRSILKAKGQQGLPEIAEKLKPLLTDREFVAATWSDETPDGKRVLFHDPETDAYVMAHVQPAGKGGNPHSHGASWAIYGNARGFTEMTEWRRVNPESEDHAVLEPSKKYRLGPGDTYAYGSGVVHSTMHPEKAWVLRITGGDLDKIPRFHFRPRKDKILEKA